MDADVLVKKSKNYIESSQRKRNYCEWTNHVLAFNMLGLVLSPQSFPPTKKERTQKRIQRALPPHVLSSILDSIAHNSYSWDVVFIGCWGTTGWSSFSSVPPLQCFFLFRSIFLFSIPTLHTENIAIAKFHE